MLETENLREQIMINQFEMATGCTREQSRQILQASRWEYVTALSSFFQDGNVVSSGACQHRACPITGHLNTVCAPCNTPATPPNFPETLLALQKMQTSDWSSSANNNISNTAQPCPQQQPNSKILAAFNPMPSPSEKLQQQNCDWSTTAQNNMAPAKTLYAPNSFQSWNDNSTANACSGMSTVMENGSQAGSQASNNTSTLMFAL